MKTKKNTAQTPQLALDSQKRLVAYTTAAGLGAFFAGQSAEAQVIESSAFTYPYSLHIGTGTGGYNYINIDGNGNDFNLDITAKRATMGGIVAGDTALNPSSNGYIIPWTVGSTVGPTGSAPTYKKWLAEDNQGAGTFLFNNFSTTKAMGFEFQSGGSGPEYFGYMDIQITASNPVVGQVSSFTSATILDIYYNATPNTPITVVPTPEPSSLALLAVGVAGLAARRARRERAK